MDIPLRGKYTVMTEEKVEPKNNVIDWPEGWAFDSDEDAKAGQLVTVRVRDEGDGKLCVTELEGIKMPGYEDEATEEVEEAEEEEI